MRVVEQHERSAQAITGKIEQLEAWHKVRCYQMLYYARFLLTRNLRYQTAMIPIIDGCLDSCQQMTHDLSYGWARLQEWRTLPAQDVTPWVKVNGLSYLEWKGLREVHQNTAKK